MTALLPPLPAVTPLAVAALLLVFSKLLPPRAPDLIAIGTALAAALCCALMVGPAAAAPLAYHFGGWTMQDGQAIGISFMVDEPSAVVAAMVALLFAAALLFAWGFFAKVHAHFHVLMLVFMAGMIGFCLTADLFNLFVWFEVMSVAGFAATGYELRPSSLAGALNFTIVNTLGAYLFLGGLGLLYAQGGALDFKSLGAAVARHPDDPVIVAAFALLAAGLLIKAAQVPFQAWLGDAHAVAPSPVSVVFSGAMVGIGVFGLAKLVWLVFAPSPPVMAVVGHLLLAMGVASALVGGAMALAQRHIKRLLAFSTISHVGVMLTGLALLSPAGTAGMLATLVGHGLVKASLFMLAGIIAALCGGIDEIELRGAGRRYWPVGALLAFGGLLLAGLPLGAMDEGFSLTAAAAADRGDRWIVYPLLAAAACTGAAVLRVAGRVFLGWGDDPGDEARSSSESGHREPADRPLPLMLAPCLALLLLGAVGWDHAGRFAAHAAASLMRTVPAPAPDLPRSVLPWLATAGAIAIAAYQLGRRHLPRPLTALFDRAAAAPMLPLRLLNSGLATDYVTWVVVGLALFSLAFAVI